MVHIIVHPTSGIVKLWAYIPVGSSDPVQSEGPCGPHLAIYCKESHRYDLVNMARTDSLITAEFHVGVENKGNVTFTFDAMTGTLRCVFEATCIAWHFNTVDLDLLPQEIRLILFPR